MLKTVISLLLVAGVIPLTSAQAESTDAFDKKSCLTLLTKTIPIQSFDSARMATARVWIRQSTNSKLQMLESLLGNDEFKNLIHTEKVNWYTAGPDTKINLAAQFILNLWERWKTTTDRQRDASLSLELMKLSGKVENSAHQWDGDVALSRLSQENLRRLLTELTDKYPINESILRKPETVMAAQKLAQDLHFEYLRPYEEVLPTGYYPAVASERELQRHSIRTESSYFSKLLDGSATVGFSVMASRMDETLFYLNGKQAKTAIRLDPGFAENNGFIMPMFTNIENILAFLKAWEPEAAQTLLRQNRFSLSRDVDNLDKFFLYAEAQSEQIFPEHNLYVKLAPFRQTLHKYVLTINDGRTFLHQAFVHFILWQASADPRRGLQNAALESAETAGLQNLFHHQFLNWLGWSGGISLRVPTVVTPNQFSILRIEPLRYGRNYALPQDRRVDKAGMP